MSTEPGGIAIDPVTKIERHILRHSLGLADKNSVEYRNRFVTGPGTVDYPYCESLVAKGLMAKREGNEMSGGDPCYFVTDAGREVARNPDAMPSAEPATDDPRKYGLDSEDFPYDDVGDVMDALDNDARLEAGVSYYSCMFTPIDLADYLDADRLLDDAGDSLYQDIGEAAEDAFSASAEALVELSTLLKAWAAKHLPSGYWMGAGNHIEHTVTAEDIAARERRADDQPARAGVGPD